MRDNLGRFKKGVASARKARFPVSCRLCGTEYSVIKSRLPITRFCSKSCIGKSVLKGLETSRMTGKKHSLETKEKMRLSATGFVHSEESKKKMSASLRGRNTGASNWMWKGGITPENVKIRGSAEMKEWRKAVFTRDDYTCQICKERGGVLNADHIKRFAHFPELRFELSNGRTLCLTCHKTTNTFGTKGMVKLKGKNKIYV